MDLHGFLRSRRSVRRFNSEPVKTEILIRILETAIHAPSAHNRQPWRFVVITKAEQKSRLANLMAVDFQRDLTGDNQDAAEIAIRVNRSISRINEAPVIIVLCMDPGEMDVYEDDRGERAVAEHTMAIQSAAAAGLQLQLAAQAEGLSSVWTCSPLFAGQTVCLVLDLPLTWEPQAMFFLGYSNLQPKEKNLKKLEDVVKFL